MNVEITCPVCNFSQKVAGEKIPRGMKRAICPVCGHRFELIPPEPPVEQEGGPPWERRMDIGLWQGIYQTFTSVLFSPGRFFRNMKSGGGIREALSFGMLAGSLGYMFSFFWEFCLISAGIMPFSGGFLDRMPVNWLLPAGMLLSPVLAILYMFVTAALIHVLMIAFKREKASFEDTFNVVAYGQSTRALAFIPFVGGVAGWFWNLVAVAAGLREAHRISGGTAAAAVLITLVLKALLLLPVILLASLFESISFLQ